MLVNKIFYVLKEFLTFLPLIRYFWNDIFVLTPKALENIILLI
jgi:hypothetical protein